jgi:nitrate reductase beta subunit
MTKLLTRAFEKASELPDELQDQIAQELLEEVEWESRWDDTLAGSQDKLEQLAEKAEQEYRSGKTKKMGFNEL